MGGKARSNWLCCLLLSGGEGTFESGLLRGFLGGNSSIFVGVPSLESGLIDNLVDSTVGVNPVMSPGMGTTSL